jgi:hypothetical protein
MKTANTAAGEAVPPPPTVSDLENPAFEAERFASILYHLLDDVIGKTHEGVTGHRNKYILTDVEINDILFIASKVEASTAGVSKMLREVL